MMTELWSIPVAALIVSMGTLLYSAITSRHRLERERGDRAERDLSEARERMDQIEQENIILMRKIIGCAELRCPYSGVKAQKLSRLEPPDA